MNLLKWPWSKKTQSVVPDHVNITPVDPWALADEFFGYGPKGTHVTKLALGKRINLDSDTWVTSEQRKKDEAPWEPRPYPRIMPKGGLVVPRSLTAAEKSAVTVSKLLDGVQLKPELKKKVKALEAGPYRVYFDAKGKMKRVKAK